MYSITLCNFRKPGETSMKEFPLPKDILSKAPPLKKSHFSKVAVSNAPVSKVTIRKPLSVDIPAKGIRLYPKPTIAKSKFITSN